LVKLLSKFKEKHIPSFLKNVNKHVPWLTKYIRKLINKRNNLYKRFRKCNHSCLKAKYVCARNLVTKQICLAKRNYERKIVKRTKNNRKTFFSYVSHKNRSNCSNKIGPLVDSKGNMVIQDREVSESLNEFFSSVFNSNNKEDDLNIVSEIISDSEKIDKLDVTEDQVVKAIDSFKMNKSPGIDGFSSTYILMCKNILAKPLALMFNKSLNTGEIPEDWKKANITPILKKGNKNSVENYRPVSLTSIIGKILEKLIKAHVESHLLSKNIIKISQHGFMKSRSCLTNLLICQNAIVQKIDEGSSVDVIYLDLQKAFDKVPHGKLISKMKSMGIVGKVAVWIEQWLKDRKQRVVINGSDSGWTDVKSGVPQGSILGPLLFTIYINDLEEGLVNPVLKFADDTKMWGVVDNQEDVGRLQGDLDTLLNWSKVNHMPFNVDKCKIMHIGRNNQKAKYMMSNQILQETKEEKDLGVFFSNTFKPSFNCNKVCKAANKMVGLIRRNIVNKTAESMMILYKTLVRPKLDYCIPAWRPYSRKDINALEKVQKRFTKMIHGCRALKYEERLHKLSITTLEERHNRADLIQVFKILNDISWYISTGLPY